MTQDGGKVKGPCASLSSGSSHSVGVLELTGVEAELTDAVKADTVEKVSNFSAVGVEVEDPLAADELVTSEGFDGFDCVLDFHGCFLIHTSSMAQKNPLVKGAVPLIQLSHYFLNFP